MKQSSVTIGIDLGTTNSVVALWDGTQARVCGSRDNQGMMPSAFGWQKPTAAGAGAFLVGRPALNNWRAAPEDTVVCVKRLMGRYANEAQVHETRERFFYRLEEDENKLVRLKVGPKSFTPVEISAQYLRHLKERAERDLGRPGAVTSAVITVPAYFEECQRAATRQAGKEAGLVVKKIIDEPTAAAIAFGFSETPKRQHMLVFDLGGGTFDISIIQFTRSQRTGAPMFEVQAIDGDNWLGGSDFDQRIVDHVVEDFKQRHQIDPRHDREFMTILRQGAEQAKISLSEDGTNQVRLTLPAAYRNDGKIFGVDLPLQREFYEKLITPDVNKAMAAVQRALDSQTLPPDGITMVLLVGGATYTPLVRQRLAELFGPAKINSSIDAMTSVAIGAAILAGKLKGIECPNSECGETQSIKDAKTGKTRTVLQHHVNDETRETCEKCSTPLAAGRAATHDIYFSEVTACSLGILAVKGDQPNAFVSLINKGATYPLSEPVRETFYPMADNTRTIRVPVFEAIDDRGAGRKLQGDILFALTEDITANTAIEVALNLDRNRIVTVAIQVKGSSIPPCIRQLELKEPPVEKAGVEKKTSWDRRLENWMRHLNQLVKRYGNYLEPRGLRAGKLKDDLERAGKALDAGDRDRPAPPEVQKILLILEADLLESGVGTQLYLADLELEGVRDESLREQAKKAQDDLKNAFDRKDQQKIEMYVAALRNLLAQIDKQRDRSKTTPEEQQYNPLDLLRKD